MAETKTETNRPRRRNWLRWLGIGAGAAVLLLVALYFIVTSSGFVTGVIVPRIGEALNADASAASAKLSPFSQIILRDFKLTPKGKETLLTASEIRARYDLWAILGGNIAVDEVAVIRPVITLVQKPDGSSNLDPLQEGEDASAEPSEGPTEQPTQVDIKSVRIENAVVQQIFENSNGTKDSTTLSNVNLTLSNLKNGQAGKLALSGALAMSNAAQESAPASALSANFQGDFTFDLTAELEPNSIKGGTVFSVNSAEGDFAELNNLVATLNCDIASDSVNEVALNFTRANQSLGQIRASGPFSFSKFEGKLKLEVLSIDRQVLNLVGAASGIDFGTTTINSSNDLEFTKEGQQISVAGQFNAAKFQVKMDGQTSPTLDLRGNYNVTVDQTAESALIKSLDVVGTQNGRPLLKTELTSPLPVSWGNTSAATSDAALKVTLTDLNLADWRAFAGDLSPEGNVNAQFNLLSQQAGKQLGFDIEANLNNFSAQFASNQIQRANIRLTARGSAANLEQFKLDESRVELARENQSALSASATGTYDVAAENADLQLTVQAAIPGLLAIVPQPDSSFTSGNLEFKGRVTSKADDQSVNGQLVLNNLTGNFGEMRFNSYGLSADLDLSLKNQLVEIRRAAGQVREAQNPGGSFEASGNFNLDQNTGKISVKLADFNQNGLRPFLQSALGDKSLVSVSLNTTASADLQSQDAAALQADLRVENLVVHDPAGTVPPTPLQVRAQVDTAVANKIAEIKQCQLTLTPTDRAKNELRLAGKVDYSDSNAVSGGLKLSAESLDLTRYYDLFAGGKTATATQPEQKKDVISAPAPAPVEPEKEPDPVTLPFRNFSLDANINEFYLREVVMTNFQAGIKLDGGKVTLNPFRFALNGAPVDANIALNLGTPGYQYDVKFSADKVPLTPLVNTFMPERKDQIGGTTTAAANIQGAGMTGAGLQKNLTGNFNFLSTNMNLSIANVRSPIINSIINVIVGLPELIRNPTAVVGNFLSKISGQGGTRDGWADQLTAAPIQTIQMNAVAGNGRASVDQAVITSSAFRATTSGDITLAPVLTNSTINFPVHIELSRSLGEKIGLVDANTPTNVAYVAFPDFLTITGTLGKNKTDIKYLALAGIAAKAGTGIAGQIGGATGEKIGGILGTVGGLLDRRKPTDTNAPSATVTNQPPATNQPNELNNLLRGLGNILGGKKSAETNQPPPKQ